MLIFSDWIIKTDGDLIARQYDNLTRELLVMGTLPEGWAWELLVQAGGSVNVIALSPRKGGVGVTLTAEMLTKAGLYALQLRGGRGEEVRHTNVIQVVVPTSLVGDATWPELPSEFSQAEANIRTLNAHPPYAGPNGYWIIWDLEAEDYVESKLPLPEVSVGPQGPEGKAASIRIGSVLTGDPGAQAAVSNSGTENDAILDFVLPRGQIGPTGPSGADGRDGKDGVPGAAATIQVGAVTTGEPGTQAQVVNVGTENAAMLQFTIPRGQPGADGRDGKNGQDGAPGPAGVGVPEISDGDEGKVMTARSGKAVWAESSGAGIKIFKYSLTARGPDFTVSTQAKYIEVMKAIQAGFYVIAELTFTDNPESGSTFIPYNSVMEDGQILFDFYSMYDAVITNFSLQVYPSPDSDPDGVGRQIVVVEFGEILPEYKTDDEGKILKIVDGKPAWASLTVYNGEVE